MIDYVDHSLRPYRQVRAIDPQTGLLVQPPFSDWMDSLKRDRCCSYLNHLYIRVLQQLETDFFDLRETVLKRGDQRSLPLPSAKELSLKFDTHFFDSETRVYFADIHRTNFSLETNLLLILHHLRQGKKLAAQNLYRSLIVHPLWRSDAFPGRPTYPESAKSEKSWTCRWVGLSGYHDRLIWSWLLGLAYRVSLLLSPEVEEAKAESERLRAPLVALTQKGVGEVYVFNKTHELKSWQSRWLKSERPFLWGAAQVYEAFSVEAELLGDNS